ncbi:MAG: SIS domain-containing protein [bacterium]|nr:SIS domain-containing protein [bacterium]
METKFFQDYQALLSKVMSEASWEVVGHLAQRLRGNWQTGNQVFICGNGGSAANAIHLANDLIYGINKKTGIGLRVNALPANQAVNLCLANDEGFEKIFSQQLAVLGNAGDTLIVFSGSGNSPNIVKALEQAKSMGIETYAILGFSGGKSKEMADHALHFPIDNMQIAEDLQQIVGHMVMRWLAQNPVN